jgi:TetR/AcrR family tetracycline transcriptional repressor
VSFALVTDQANPTSIQALKPLDDAVGALYEAGFDDVGVRRGLSALTSLLFGSLLLTSGGFAREPVPNPEREGLDVYVRRVDPVRLPHFSRLLPAIKTSEPESDFEYELDLLIDGLVRAAPREPGSID